MSVRTEWARVIQGDPRMTLGDAVHVVGQRHSIWPRLSGFKPVKPPHNAKFGGKGVWSRVIFSLS